MTKPCSSGYYIGIISGTSVDAIDCALIETGQRTRLVAHHAGYYSADLRERILNLCEQQNTSLLSLGRLSVEIGQAFAEAARALLAKAQLRPSSIAAIGTHGQTVFHHPDAELGFSLQIGDPNTIAHLTGITTIADFRQRDIVSGGQGAPLAPLFHQHYFHSADRCRAVLNIGGMANISWLDRQADGTPRGFDTGPGNVLMDGWIHRHMGQPYDAGGSWAGGGQVVSGLLARMLDDDYFAAAPPKSTGRERFNMAWLDSHLTGDRAGSPLKPQDVQRTLLELTAVSIAESIHDTLPEETGKLPKDLLVCGGGAHNGLLMQRLQELLPDFAVEATDALSLHPDWVEAATFAWLACQTLDRRSFDTGPLTGARSPVILGGIYYGK